MSKFIHILVGPPGCGKSTYAKKFLAGATYINQDSQGRGGHLDAFIRAVDRGENVVVDRMNFDKGQRRRYLDVAKSKGYHSTIIVFHESYNTCLKRAIARQGHETIKDEETARKAISFFFKTYERPTEDEADKLEFRYPEGAKPAAVICDLDGTLCNIEHRRHFVRGDGKKNWKAFFQGIPNDKPNKWCADLLASLAMGGFKIVYCSGRGEEEREATVNWLIRNRLDMFENVQGIVQDPPVFMRQAGDSRKDSIVKEILLDFEILTRYTPSFMIDDRTQVVQMWRKRGYVCLQCDEGNF
jgi:predicted kinase